MTNTAVIMEVITPMSNVMAKPRMGPVPKYISAKEAIMAVSYTHLDVYKRQPEALKAAMSAS